MPKLLPPLPLADWQPTRRTLHSYVQVLGAVRAALAPRQKQAYHLSLRLTAAGLTTTPLPADPHTFELRLDLTEHLAELVTSQGAQWYQTLTGQPGAEFYEQVVFGLREVGVSANVERPPLATPEGGPYDQEAVGRFWSALAQIDQVLKRFRAEQREETGAVQFWPHGFDLACLWFSGRKVPGQDPAHAARADEQMNFGFSTGDGGIPEPYFYATAYPLPPALSAAPWPADVHWHNQAWNGAVLPYARLVGAPDAEDRLLNCWRTFQRAGAALMR